MTAPLARILEDESRQRYRATAGIVWGGRAAEPLRIVHHWGFGSQNLDQLAAQWQGNERLLQQALQSGQLTRATGALGGAVGAQPLEIVACPIWSDATGRVLGQLFFTGQTAFEAFLQAGGITEQLALFQQAARAWLQSSAEGDQPRDSSFSGNSSADSSPATRAAALVLRLEAVIAGVDREQRLTALLNELGLQTEARRCSLWRLRAGAIELLSCSGVLQVEPRAPALTELRTLLRSRLLATGELTEAESLSPADPLQTELAPRLCLIPLETSSAPAGRRSRQRLLVLEWERSETEFADRLSAAELAAWKMALREASPPEWTPQGQDGSGWKRWGVGLGLLAAGLLIPIPLTISAPGYYVPRERSTIYAPETGVITAADLHIPADRQVERGTLLLTITSRELELKLGQVQGALATTSEQIRSLRSTRPDRDPTPGSRLTTSQDVSLQLAELTARQTGLQQELALLQERKASLQVRSPLSGMILSWEPETQLAGRPVSRGQLLLTVGQLQGGWDVLAEVRDRDLGHFKQGITQRTELELRPHMPALANSLGKLEKLSPVLQEVRPGEWAAPVLLQAEITGPAPLPGARVTARLPCGYYPLGYVWFRHLLIPLRQFFTW